MALSPSEQDRLRLAIMHDVELLADAGGGFIDRQVLLDYTIEGRRLPLIDYGGRGIRNPADFDCTLSIVSSLDGPYPDRVGEDGLFRYSLRTGDPNAGDNRKLRRALVERTPLILFQKPVKNVYVPTVPVYVVDEDSSGSEFLVATDDAVWRSYQLGVLDPEIDKKYVAQVVRRRVHQPVFRARVILAYAETCAICRLKHRALLDAAHITPDNDADGLAHVTNGLALCKIHHAAFDQNLIGISPDYRVHVSAAVMSESDGPMLKHGIQEMDGVTLHLPRAQRERPSEARLETRFAAFKAAS